MICCKIIANFRQDSALSKNSLIDLVSEAGDCLFSGNSLFFCSLEEEFDEKSLKKILKKCKITNYFINIYDQENPPRENDDVNIWLANKLIQMNYKKYEIESQKAFRDISKGLDMIDQELERMEKEEQEQRKKENTKSQI